MAADEPGTMAEVAASIARLNATLAALPPDSPLRPTTLRELAALLKSRFELLGDQADLDLAIALVEQALDCESATSGTNSMDGWMHRAEAYHARYQHRRFRDRNVQLPTRVQQGGVRIGTLDEREARLGNPARRPL